MRIDITEILKDDVKKNFSPRLEFDAVLLRGEKFDIVRISPVKLALSHVSPTEFIVECSLDFDIYIPCDRCLEPVKKEFDIEILRHIDMKDVKSDMLGDADGGFDYYSYINGHYLDVDLLIHDEILANWPTKVLCREDCKGICPVCGKNRNKFDCSCDEGGKDPRMAAIADIFKAFNPE